MNLKAKSLMIMSLAVIMSACTSGAKTFNIPESEVLTRYGLAGRLARTEYRGLLGSSIGSLNYMKSAGSVNAQHFANFVDPLLTHNSYGALVKNLATKVERSEDFTEFKFTVRQGVMWQDYKGAQYKANVDGKKTPQFVEASDWRTTAEAILTVSNGSDLAYLIIPFVKGAAEYYAYTSLKADYKDGNITWDPGKEQYAAQAAKAINKYIKTNYGTVWHLEYADGDDEVSASDVANIKNGSRLGIVADDAARTITYSLNQPASFFPTLFTYSCFLPTNKYFLKDKGFSNFGTSKDTILYCGPYLLSKVEDTAVEYIANKNYWNAENTITIGSIKYRVITGSVDKDYVRREFEADRVDGFSVNYEDAVGWNFYIEGPDGSGTLEDPYSPLVNARLLDTIGNCYGSNIVLDRDKTGSDTSYATKAGGSKNTIKNTAKALSIKEVRKALIQSLDFELYYQKHYSSKAEDLRLEEKVYTYVPKGFVVDSEGNDYVTKYYYQEYAEKQGLSGGAGDPDDPQPNTAAYELKPGQVDTANLSLEEVAANVRDAVTAVNVYNASNSSKITFPIYIEYYSAYFDEDTKEDDEAVIESMNARLNQASVLTETGLSQIFKVIPTTDVTSANYDECSGSKTGTACFDYAPIMWGWGADYGDPLTYMNTFVKGGDWSSVFPFIGRETVDNYSLNEAKNALIKTDLLEEYTRLVEEGANEVQDITARYTKFAKAEYNLINEIYIYLPQNNNGQGYSMSVSRSAGYFMPTASYGLSNDRMTGLYVLDAVMTRADRKKAREEQLKDKEEYFETHDAINDIYKND